MPKRKKEPSLLRDAVEIIALLAVAGLVLWGLSALISAVFDQTREMVTAKHILAPDAPCEGVGRIPEAARYLGGVDVVDVPTLEIACEDDDPLPDWWDPDAADIVWEDDHSADVGKMVDGDKNVPRRDGGCPDWNLNTSLVGWDGRTMEVWEMDLFSRIIYLEFNGVEPECMNAGIDSVLNLWTSEYFGKTIFETLSARAENGALAYTTYGYVWEWDYDYSVLEEIKTLCVERFKNGPNYGCHFFQLYGFPTWAKPLYEIDQVYFSTFKDGTWRVK